MRRDGGEDTESLGSCRLEREKGHIACSFSYPYVRLSVGLSEALFSCVPLKGTNYRTVREETAYNAAGVLNTTMALMLSL